MLNTMLRYSRRAAILAIFLFGLEAIVAQGSPGLAATPSATQDPTPAASSVRGQPTGAMRMVDLTDLDLYVRPGFQLEWSYYEPDAKDAAWTRLPAHKGNRPVILRDLPIAGKHASRPFKLKPVAPDIFTAIVVFEASGELLDSSTGVGLYLQDIGKNWEVYLNGSPIVSEVNLNHDGVISRERAIHGALVDVDKRFLKPGKNILTFVIMGSPDDYRTGLFSPSPYLLGDYQELLKLKSEYLDLMLIGIYFFFSLYHLILFALRPSNRPYLFYGLGTLAFAIYLFARSYIVFDLIADTALIRGLELSSLFVFFPLFLAFFDVCNRSKVTLFTWIYGGICLVFAFFAPLVWGENILKVWQETIAIPVIYLLAFDCVIPIVKGLGGEKGLGFRERIRRFSKANNFWTVVITVIIIVLCVIASFFDLNSAKAFTAAKLGAFFLIFGTATVLARQFTSIYRDVEEFTQSLEAKVEERTSALAGAMKEQSSLNQSLSSANLRLQNAMDLSAKDMRIAVQVQQGIFPQRPPEACDWDLAFVYQPEQGVSGDFYDFYMEGDKLTGAVVGDVSGHGISSGLITVLARSIFYRGLRDLSSYSLGRIVEEINGELSKELSAVENYLTASVLRFDGSTVEYVNAANTDLAFRRVGKARANFVKPTVEGFKGPPLGREGMEVPYQSVKFTVDKGDSLLIYTDCLSAAVNEEGVPFGSEGLLSAYGMAPADSAADMLAYILEEWKFHVGSAPTSDDLTALLIKKK